MAQRRRPRNAATENAAAGAEFRRQDRGLALARTRSAHRARRRPGGCLMNAAIPRPSRFIDAGGTPRIRVSFEFFPPRTAEMEQTLGEAINRLSPLRPNFVSVTYGACGPTPQRTHAPAKRILAYTTLVPPAPLTRTAAASP